MYLRLSIFVISGLLVSQVMANPKILKNDPNRPVGKISKNLDITSKQFIECFNNVNPTPGGQRPESEQRVQSNKKVLLSCLKKYNQNITNDSLDTVMDRYRPGGRDAQRPMK